MKLVRNKSGFVAFFVVICLVALVLLLSSALAVTRGAYLMSQSVDTVRQQSIEKRSLEEAVKRVIMAKVGVAPTNSTETTDALLDVLVARMNTGSQGVTFTRSATSPSLPVHRMFPDGARPAIISPSLAGLGVKYQMASILRDGTAEVTATPLVWSFSRTGPSAAENRTLTVSARLWSVPMSNYGLIAYSLPTSVSGGLGVPKAAPGNTSGLLGASVFTGNNGRALLVTTQRPNPPYSDGDPTAYPTLYVAPQSGQAESISRHYHTHAAMAWDAWEYFWSNSYQLSLISSAGSGGVYDFDAVSQPAITGVTVNSSTAITVGLQSITGSILGVVDSVGGRSVTINAGTSGTPLVVVIRNTGSAQTIVNLAGNNQRTTIIYARNCTVNFVAGASFTGAVYLDRNSTITGSGSVQGTVAFYAPNGFPAVTFSLTPPIGAVKADLDSIAPRALLVTTTSVIN